LLAVSVNRLLPWLLLSVPATDQVPAGSLGVDPVEQFLDVVRAQVAPGDAEDVGGEIRHHVRVGAAPGEVRGHRVHVRPVEPLEFGGGAPVGHRRSGLCCPVGHVFSCRPVAAASHHLGNV
jgi:hypothetical protein